MAQLENHTNHLVNTTPRMKKGQSEPHLAKSEISTPQVQNHLSNSSAGIYVRNYMFET